MMKMYALSLGVGVLVGVLYYLLNVKSPAPPYVALLGLLGMVMGEKLIPLLKTLMWFESQRHGASLVAALTLNIDANKGVP